MSETTIREAINNVSIEGIVKEKNLEVKVYEGKTNISGTVSIETGENAIHTIKVFVNEITKDGKENNGFKGMKTVMEEYVSVAEGLAKGLSETEAKGNATKVTVNKGKLSLNDYYIAGDLKSYPQFPANYIKRIKSTFSPKAEFEIEMFFSKINKEIKDSEETGRLLIEGIVPLYGGKVVPIQFVADGDVATYLDNNYETGKTGKVWGELINTVDVKLERNSGFGKEQEKKIEKTKHELLITGGEETQYSEDSDKAYSVEQIKKAMAERDIMLDEKLKESKANDKGKKSNGKSTAGKKAEFKF